MVDRNPLCGAYFISRTIKPLYIVSIEPGFVENYSPCNDYMRQIRHCRMRDEDKCLCIILYSHDGMFDIVAVPSLGENGCTPPQAQWLHITLWKTKGRLTLYN